MGVSVDNIRVSGVTPGEAIDLIDELQRELGSHLVADLAGWKFATTYGDLLALTHAEAFMNVNRDRKKQRTPIELFRPWESEAERAQVSPEERARLRAQLLERSAFRDMK